MIDDSLPGSHDGPPMDAPAKWWFRAAYLIWILGVFGYFIPPPSWSPTSRFALTSSIVEHRELTIDRFSEATGDRARVADHWYTEKPPIPSLFAIPPYAIYHVVDRLRGRSPEFSATAISDTPAVRVVPNLSLQRGLYVCSLTTAGLSGALVALLLFELLSRRFGPFESLFASVATVLGTPIFPYATSFYGHTIAAAFFMAGLVALMLEPGEQPPSRLRLRMAGAFFALAAGSEYVVAGPALLACAVFVLAMPKDARVRISLEIAIGALGPALVVGAYHWVCFGAPWRTGYAFVVRPEFAAGHSGGLLGIHPPKLDVVFELLVGRRRGLCYVAPMTAIAIVGLVAFAVQSRDLCARAGGLALALLLLLNAGYYMWWGGAAAAPRHLIPALGVLGFGVAAANRVRWLRFLLYPLVILSILNMIAISGVGVEAPEHGDVLLDYVYPQLWAGRIATLSGASNLGVLLGLSRPLSLLPVVGWIIGGFVYLTRRLHDDAPARTAVPAANSA